MEQGRELISRQDTEQDMERNTERNTEQDIERNIERNTERNMEQNMEQNTETEVKQILRKPEICFQVRENRTALICGVLAVGVVFFILAMRLLHPSGRGGGALLYVPLVCMLAGGVFFLVLYYNRKLTVSDMELCYVNLFGRRKDFTLDQIGFCKIGAGGSQNLCVLYDLMGEKLCKLDFDMRGMAQFHQYLVDNQVEVEWNRERMDRRGMLLIDVIQRESAVCEEEICKCSEQFREEAEKIFLDWEKRNARFQADWEIGFGEYQAADLEQKCFCQERTSSLPEILQTLPDTYECLLEAYLRREDGYVVDSRGEVVNIVLPYLVRSKSYRVGEGTRIRKMDEQSMQDWLILQLEALSRELPRHKYRTETLVLKHKLGRTAGILAAGGKESGGKEKQL